MRIRKGRIPTPALLQDHCNKLQTTWVFVFPILSCVHCPPCCRCCPPAEVRSSLCRTPPSRYPALSPAGPRPARPRPALRAPPAHLHDGHPPLLRVQVHHIAGTLEWSSNIISKSIVRSLSSTVSPVSVSRLSPHLKQEPSSPPPGPAPAPALLHRQERDRDKQPQ